MYKSGLMQPLISFFMMVSKVAWWLMKWVCRRLWALYPPNMKFLYYPHVDPVKVAMALNPSRLPHWGRFVTFSMWLQGYLPRLTDRVRVFNTDLCREPQFKFVYLRCVRRLDSSDTMAKRRQRPKTKEKQDLLSTYTDPRAPGALGGLRRFARAQRLSQAQACDALRKSLTFTLHRPPRRRFKMMPVMVLNIDQQWVADLVEMQQYWRQNRGVRYLLTVIDVWLKYEWVCPIKRTLESL